jgi:hypothetical protein
MWGETSAVIETRAHPSSRGTTPTTRLLATTRHLQVPLESPMVLTVSHRSPHAALNARPPRIAPTAKSIKAFCIRSPWTRLPFSREFEKHLFEISLAEPRDNLSSRSLGHDLASLEEDDAVRHFLHFTHVV